MLTWYPLIIHDDCHQIIIPCVLFKSLGSTVNKYGGFKCSYSENLRDFGIKAIMKDVFFKYLQARY